MPLLIQQEKEKCTTRMGNNEKMLKEIGPPYAGGREKKKLIIGGMHFTDKD